MRETSVAVIINLFNLFKHVYRLIPLRLPKLSLDCVISFGWLPRICVVWPKPHSEHFSFLCC